MRPILLLLAVFPAICTAQERCPLIKGEVTDGGAVELPAASAGHHAILCVAAGKKAEPMLQEWYAPAYERFVVQHGLFAAEHKADLWLVPVFTGLNKAAFGPTMKRLREQADPDVARRVLFVRDEAAALLDALAIKDRDEPVFLVLDPSGRIVHREHGSFSVDKLDALEEALDR
jgi:hypothetical protein